MNCSNSTNFIIMFSHCSSLKNVDGLKNWNVSNVIDFAYMFYKCCSLQNIDGLSNWNVKNVKDFRHMFDTHDGSSVGFSSLQNLDVLKNWMFQMELIFIVCLVDVVI